LNDKPSSKAGKGGEAEDKADKTDKTDLEEVEEPEVDEVDEEEQEKELLRKLDQTAEDLAREKEEAQLRQIELEEEEAKKRAVEPVSSPPAKPITPIHVAPPSARRNMEDAIEEAEEAEKKKKLADNDTGDPDALLDDLESDWGSASGEEGDSDFDETEFDRLGASLPVVEQEQELDLQAILRAQEAERRSTAAAAKQQHEEELARRRTAAAANAAAAPTGNDTAESEARKAAILAKVRASRQAEQDKFSRNVEAMKSGVTLLKIPRNRGSPSEKVLRLFEENGAFFVGWDSKKSKQDASVRLEHCQLALGTNAGMFLKKKYKKEFTAQEHMCFSLVSEEKTVDFVALNPFEYELCTSVLHMIILKGGKAVESSA